MAKKIDASIWSFYLFSVNLTNLFILYSRRKNVISEKKETIDNQSTEDTLINHDTSRKIAGSYKNYFIALRVINGLMKLTFLIISIFLLIGAAIDGTGRPKARGKFVNVKIDDSSTYIQVHYLCSSLAFDNNNNNNSIVMFEGGVTNSLTDFLGLQ